MLHGQMYITYLLLLIVSSLAYTTNCLVYYVVPDDHYLATNNNTLQHYLNNSDTYFTSNAQLVFLPGKHHLHTDLTVENVMNISLHGVNQTEMNNTIIHCTTSTRVVIINSDNICIRYISMKDCGGIIQKQYFTSSLNIINCSHILIQYLCVMCQFQQCGLMIVNAVQTVTIDNIMSSYLMIKHSMTKSNSTIVICNYTHIGKSSYKHRAIEILLYEHSQYIIIKFFSLKLNSDKAVHIFSSTSKGTNKINITGMALTGMTFEDYIVMIKMLNDIKVHDSDLVTTIEFVDCHFSNMNGNKTAGPGLFEITVQNNFYITQISSISMIRCTFNNVTANYLLKSTLIARSFHFRRYLVVSTQNTSFSMLRNAVAVIWLEGTELFLKGPVVFTKINSNVAIIHAVKSFIILSNHITFTLNKANYCMVVTYVTLEEDTKMDIIANHFLIVFYTAKGVDMCLFQYYQKQAKSNHQWQTPQQPQHFNYSIMIQDNIGDAVYNRRYATSHCDWDVTSVFIQSDPYEVNRQIVNYVNNTMALKMSVPNTICHCTDDQHYNCSIDELGPVYPGQTYGLTLIVNSIKYKRGDHVEMTIDPTGSRACKSHSLKDQIPLLANCCNKIEYNILCKNGYSCDISIKGTIESVHSGVVDTTHAWESNDVYRIKIFPCPLGFALNEMLQICQCDPILKTVTITSDNCNINDQTIWHPANSWITGRTNVDNSHTYQVSLHCPFDYCLPHSSLLDLSNPDSQCQFNRTGVLCGRCKKGLSAVFGTSQCKQCSNHYLFLLLLFILAGFVFMMFLFIFNFTVADGSMNGLVFYANIVSINGPVFFPSYEPTKYVYVLISFLNLDLGIEVCFYNGMDNYAKMWLQLIFPIYLIFIATLLIITSRYSTRIQRFTAHRALPVLATLFLLSYTKILRTVSSVLFSYSTIISLPSKNTTLVWSVETEVRLFGLKFIVLFIVCLVLFLILLPFNTVLIFTRTLSQFKCINHFKPLLDAYQGPYKDRFYYWTGLQLLLRAVFYGISALDRNTNMMIGILIFGVMECMYGSNCPSKYKSKNYQELMLIFNLQSLFVVSLYTTSNSIAVNTLVCIATVQFVISILYQKVLYRMLKSTAFTKFSKYFTLYSHTQPPRCIELHNTIPEVAFNYKELREPLIDWDD